MVEALWRKKGRRNCLYLTYDGLTDPLGQSQILPYLERFVAKGIQVSVVSFEKIQMRALLEQDTLNRKRLLERGIRWLPLRYHKWPPVVSTLVDVFQGIIVCSWLCWRHPPVIVHARSYVASLLALWVKRVTGARFLFDMRGFWPEERVEGGLCRPNGFLYRCTKWWEKRFFRAADGIVVLSHVAKALLEKRLTEEGRRIPIIVIPTCTDLQRFVSSEKVSKTHLTRIVYVGSVGTWYLFREMVHFFQVLQRRIPEARFTVLTPRPDPLLLHALKGLERQTYEVQNLTHEEVPEVLRTMHASLCFIKPVGSKRASCPTKVGESLACGVPIVITKDVGDCDTLVGQERVGIVLSEFSEEGYVEAVERLIALTKEGDSLGERCRRTAQKYFDLEQGAEHYLSFYDKLLSGEEAPFWKEGEGFRCLSRS